MNSKYSALVFNVKPVVPPGKAHQGENLFGVGQFRWRGGDDVCVQVLMYEAYAAGFAHDCFSRLFVGFECSGSFCCERV